MLNNASVVLFDSCWLRPGIMDMLPQVNLAYQYSGRIELISIIT